MESFAGALSHNGSFSQAEQLFKKVYDQKRIMFGDNNAATTKMMLKLAASFSSQGRYCEAISMQEEIICKYRDLLGNEHRNIQSARNGLALDLLEADRDGEVMPLAEHNFNILRDKPREDTASMPLTMEVLACCYSKQKHYVDARSMQDQIVEVRRRILGEKHLHTIYSIQRLARIISLPWKLELVFSKVFIRDNNSQSQPEHSERFAKNNLEGDANRLEVPKLAATLHKEALTGLQAI